MATRILVVNDTQEILELFQIMLENEGYEVVLSSFPFQHTKEIEKIQPDLIILDFLFGDKHLGWQMLQILKIQTSTASIPIIACTAALQEVREQEGYLNSQGVHIVYKPFDVGHLLATIQQVLVTHKRAISQVKEDRTATDWRQESADWK